MISSVVLPAGIVTPIPENMSDVIAATFPIAYGTAHFALSHRGRLQAGETLLVLGATGGGKLMGARVIAAAGSPEKLAVATAHGADETIDYRLESLRERVKELTDGRGAESNAARRHAETPAHCWLVRLTRSGFCRQSWAGAWPGRP